MEKEKKDLEKTDTFEKFQAVQDKKRGNLGLILFLILIIICLVGYICYDKGVFDSLLGKDKTVEEPKQEEIIGVSDEELNRLIESVPTAIYPIGPNSTVIDAYTDKSVTIKDVSSYVLLNCALKDLKESDFSIDEQSHRYYVSFDKINEKINAVYKSFDSNGVLNASDIVNTGSGAVILSKEFNIDDNSNVNGDLLYYDKTITTKGLVLETFQKSKGEILKNDVKRYKNDDDIVVEQRVVAISRPIDLGEKYNLYSTSNGKTIVYSASSMEDAEKYFNENSNLFNIYKQTFKKASDGKYYWYSSEIVNE